MTTRFENALDLAETMQEGRAETFQILSVAVKDDRLSGKVYGLEDRHLETYYGSVTISKEQIKNESCTVVELYHKSQKYTANLCKIGDLEKPIHDNYHEYTELFWWPADETSKGLSNNFFLKYKDILEQHDDFQKVRLFRTGFGAAKTAVSKVSKLLGKIPHGGKRSPTRRKTRSHTNKKKMKKRSRRNLRQRK